MRRWYQPHEDEIIQRLYPKRGLGYVSRKLDRPRGSVRTRARRLGVRFGVIPNTMTVSEVARHAGRNVDNVRKAARIAGVATTIKDGYKGHVIVPEQWGREYIKTAIEREEAALLHGYYYDADRTARLIGIARRTLACWCRGRGDRGRAFRDRVRWVTGPGGVRLFNPYDVEAYVGRKSDWMTVKQAADALDIKASTLRCHLRGRRGRRGGIVPHLRVMKRGQQYRLNAEDVRALRRVREADRGDLQAFKRTLEASDA